MYDLVLLDATVVSPSGRVVADVAILNGRIVYVGPRPPRPARREIRAIGKFLMPGVIDTAVQFDPTGDGAHWLRESGAAVTGGVTTVVNLPGGGSSVVDQASAEARIRSINGHSFCDYGLWGAAGGRLRQALTSRVVVGAYAEVGTGAPGARPMAELGSMLDVPGPIAIQVDPTAEGTGPVVEAARALDRAIHLIHVSTANELHLIDPVHGAVPVTAGVTPHHLFLTAETSEVATRPPVSAEHDRRTLWSAAKRRRLDAVASDHHLPCEGTGLPGSELLLPLMLSAVKQGRIALETMVQLCCEGPAQILGLTTKGRVARGYDADLVLFTEGELTRVAEDHLLSGAGWSPYLDREASPKPDLVLVAGEIVASRGQLVGESPRGLPLHERRPS